MKNYLLIWVLCGVAFAALVVTVLLVRQCQITNRLRKRIASLENGMRAYDEEVWYFAAVRVPAVGENLRQGIVEVPGPQHPELTETPFGQSLDMVLNLVAESVASSVALADSSAKATVKSMMRTVQTLANEQQVVISEMQDRHDDPAVLADLMKIDHANSQLGRRAQAAAVLCGSWPGQQRSPASITDVVRGAISRIRDYLRIKVHEHSETALVSTVVEPVVLAIAELLDNAARYSPPSTSVEVYCRSSHNGLAVVIDDAGVGMNNEQVHHASWRLSPQQSVDISRLGDPPQLGFPVIGVLAARYHFSVSVDTRSPYGGVRAIVFLPNALLTSVSREPATVHPSSHPPSGSAASPAANHLPSTMNHVPSTMNHVPSTANHPPSTATHPPSDSDAPTKVLTTGGLPKRRRREQVSDEPVANPAAPSRDPQQIAAGMGAWQRGTQLGRDAGTSSPATNYDTGSVEA